MMMMIHDDCRWLVANCRNIFFFDKSLTPHTASLHQQSTKQRLLTKMTEKLL